MSKPGDTLGNQCGIVIDQASIEDQGLWTCKIYTQGNVFIGNKTVTITGNILEIDNEAQIKLK